ncbi:type II CRISPR RNA-guided endonuclease Cas9 [Adlercreutzia sp. ZJ141]|uniref:type II CRISPR RNA-guided endonuclease Cas9 n=1 Tax=Adlercreutzia sp. ZJ141 TaxID=2709406 RepID=UPI0013EB9F2F|nr:type II CRISPR RNA-guided endonuclease Cas9 [Adlercreutzia sp. ZJ141]
MNLRNVDEYSIGLDIGTGSVGWAVTDAEGNLCHFKGKPTWGSRLFPNAEPASAARVPRGQRRRYVRRRWRLDLLQEFFLEEMNRIDPEFFVRLGQSRLLSEDREEGHVSYTWPLFNNSNFSEKDYYKAFPTIYHLRAYLMETDEKADIRLIYLALHNIVKHRGNFLQQGNKELSSKHADMDASVQDLCLKLSEWCDEKGISCTAQDNAEAIAEALGNTQQSRTAIKERIVPLLGIAALSDADEDALAGFNAKAAKNMAKALAGAIVGVSAELAHVFFIGEEAPEDKKTKISLSKDDEVEDFEAICPEEARLFFDSMRAVYSSYVLQGLLSANPGGSLSQNKVAEYNRYKDQLKMLKALVKDYAPEKFDAFFRGSFYPATEMHPQKYMYDKAKAKGYTKYNEVHGMTSYDEFKKETQGLFKGTAAEADGRYLRMIEDFENERFLRRLKTSDNGAIPFQLHLEEMHAIIQNQSRFYPFLAEHEKELESLVEFRIPYYVGPLTQKGARRAGDKPDGDPRFAWSIRKPGMEDTKIYPWNWEDIIDKDASAEAFIRRMTGTCTYLQGEPVLPKSSLLYEEFCVLNELNGARFTQDGDKKHRFDYADRTDMMEELFKQRKGKITYKKVSDWMAQSPRCHSHVHVSGGQGESGFESKLTSYHFFKDVLGVEDITGSDYDMVEEIILWSTLFEDRGIFRDKLKTKYGERLTSEKIDKIVRKRFTGWGKLSKKLLCEIKVSTDDGERSIMDVLREGNPNYTGKSHGNAMVLMEVLHDDNLEFTKVIDDWNKEHLLGAGLNLEDLPGSPALRRSISQALLIVKEIVDIAGHAPANIFVEVARGEDAKKRGQRTKRRYDALKDAMTKLKENASGFWDSEVSKELAEHAKGNVDLNERLTLYFMQGGKSLYSGTPIKIERLSSGDYHVDHIIPQSYIKDDSFENKALVLASENEAKSDQMLIDQGVRRKMAPYWRALHDAKLIGDKKYNNLMRSGISERQMKGFVARQLVETHQVVKTVQMLLDAQYPEVSIVPIKAALSHELREFPGKHKREKDGIPPLFPKCREANDFHHAHDALLAAEIGRFILKRHNDVYENPIRYAKMLRAFVKREANEARRGHLPGDSSFLIKSFMRPGYDTETGEIVIDDWAPNKELERLKRYFDCRQCFISRMPEETSGAFWTATIYSPRGGKKAPGISLKKGLDPMKYGGYSGTEFAYFFIYKAMNKKGVSVLEFAQVPVSVASSITSHSDALAEYARGLAKEKGFEFVKIVRPKIYKRQLMEFDGNRLYLTGKREARNAVAVAFNRDEMWTMLRVIEGKPTTSAERDRVFLTIVSSLKGYSPKLSQLLQIERLEGVFSGLGAESQGVVLRALVEAASGARNMVILECAGGSKYAGCIHPSYSNILTKGGGITFIDQSVTGMFERRTHIGL